MSAGTETQVPAPPPLLARVKQRLARIVEDPNPIWARELQQSIRRGHSAATIMLVTGGAALLVTAVGGTVGAFRSPASTGSVIYQTFFSIAFFLVLLLGPALAANSIVSEREGRTWEAVLLTGMTPAEIARGKFLSAFTAIALYIVALAPVGAICFLFGGVTAFDVVFAFAYLFALAALSVAFGLAVSSKMQRLGTAIVTTLLLAVHVAPMAFGIFGVGLSVAAHDLWPRVPEGSPVWLPIAYERATFGIDYVYFLFLLPLVALGIPGWFFYEATIANLASASDDRSSGLKRWFFASAVALVLAGAILPFRVGAGALEGASVAIVTFAGFLAFACFVFVGEALGPSRRVRAAWEHARASSLVRFMGPGLVNTFRLVVGTGLVGLVLLAAAGFAAIAATSRSASEDSIKLGIVAVYAAAFFLFTGGFCTWMRARANTPSGARLTSVIVIATTMIVPWLFAATAGALADVEGALLLAAPSPFFVIVMVEAVKSYGIEDPAAVGIGLATCALWAAVGIGCFFGGRKRCERVIREHEVLLIETDRLLEAEDRAMAAATGQPVPGESVEPSAP